MNDALAGKVFPTIRFVLELIDRRTQRGAANPGIDDLTQLRKLLEQFDVSGPDRPTNLLARDALVGLIDHTLFANGTAGRDSLGIATPPSGFEQLAQTADQIASTDAAETLHLCSALGLARAAVDRATALNPAAAVELRRRFDEWSRAAYLKIAAKPPDAFNAYASAVSYDPDQDALPLAGKRSQARSKTLLAVTFVLFVAVAGLWAWLRFG